MGAYEQALRLELALTSPLAYAAHVAPWFEAQAHLRFLDDLIVKLTTDQLRDSNGKVIRRLAISAPPRHGKSTLSSEFTPAWALTKYPDWRVLLAGYGTTFASKWGRLVRDHIDDAKEFGVHLSKDSKAVDDWNLASPNRGGMSSAGIGGGFTGKGANLLVIDDPIKTSAEAQSETMRQNLWEWWLGVAKTRLEPSGYVIILATRWHEDDLIGRLIDHQPDRWLVVNLPALAEDDDVLGREPGEALCPDWYDEGALEDIAADEEDGAYFTAMYQGHPTTKGGGILKEAEFRYWGRQVENYVLKSKTGDVKYVPARDCTRIQTVDLAATKKTRSDWSVIATWDVTPAREALLVDLVRVRIESSDHREWLIEHYNRLKPKYAIVESKTYGLALLQGGYKDGLVLKPGNTGNDDKVANAIPAGRAIAKGRIYFPPAELAPWLPQWVAEMTGFPHSKHDDQVDVLSMLAEEITTGALQTPSRPKAAPEEDGLSGRLARYRAAKRKEARRPTHPELGRLA